MRVPLRSGDSCPRRGMSRHPSFRHHVIPRIKVLPVLFSLISYFTATATSGEPKPTFCILVKRFLPGTLPYILNAF